MRSRLHSVHGRFRNCDLALSPEIIKACDVASLALALVAMYCPEVGMLNSFTSVIFVSLLLLQMVYASLLSLHVAFILFNIYHQAAYPWDLRYHAYFMEDIDSWLVIFSDWVAVTVCTTAMLGLVRNSERHRRWIWYSLFGGVMLAVFWLYYMLRLPKFRWEVIWLPFGPLSGAGICLYVDHLLNESSEEVRKLRSYMYAYKAS